MPTLVQIFMEKGKAKGKAELIIALLEDRFSEIPQAIQDAVIKVSDTANLRQLNFLASKCKSLAEFKKALK